MWVVAALGLWVLVTPFFWGRPNASGFWERQRRLALLEQYRHRHRDHTALAADAGYE